MMRFKRALSVLLAALTVLSMLAAMPLAVFAEGEADTQPVWPAEGSVKLEKDAKAVGGEDDNLWEVTLGIQGKNYKTTSDVVLVIDNSNSMYTEKGSYGSTSFVEDKDSRMYKTKIAAKAFADKLLTEDSATRIALVVFNLEETHTGFYTYEDKEALKARLDEISVDRENGGTFTQLGIKTARDILRSEASTGKNKNIVLLSDGLPTKSFKVNAVSATVTSVNVNIKSNCKSFGRHYVPTITASPSYTAAISGCDYTSTVGDGYEEDYATDYTVQSPAYFNHDKISGSWSCSHSSASSKTWNYIINENRSNGSKNSTGRISGYSEGNIEFSTSFTAKKTVDNLGEPTVWEADQAKAEGVNIYSIALQAGNVGSGILRSCATNPSKDYFTIADADNIEEKLTTAFTSIAGSIAIAAKNAVVNDTMGDKVQLSFSGEAPVITTDRAVYDAGDADVYISQGTATYDAATRSISWTVGNVREGDDPTLMYKVTVRDGYSPATGETLLTNESATLTYTDYEDKEVTGEFPKPQVTVGGGKILVHYYLVNGNGEPINENGVKVESPSLAKQVKDAEYFAVDGTTGLKYNTLYTVGKADVADCVYYGSYIIDNGALTGGDSAEVTLTAANSNRHVWFAYKQEFTVVHVREDTEVGRDTHAFDANFDMTQWVNKKADGTKITDGHFVYGGTFKSDYTTVADFNGGTAMDFTPTPGGVYYIWEAPAVYLLPRSLSVWKHVSESDVDVIGFYMMSAVDRLNYYGVGFDAHTENGTVIDAHDVGEADPNALTVGSVYKSLTVKHNNGTESVYAAGTGIFGDIKDSGYLFCFDVPKNYWTKADDRIVFTPYWITLDGVKVTGIGTRTCEYKGAGSDNDLTYKKLGKAGADTFARSKCTGYTVPTDARSLIYSASYTLDSGAADYVTVTVNDGGSTRSVVAAKGDVSAAISYAGASGKLFAGWFTDKACKYPADLRNVTSDITVYAKYVSDSYLDVRYTKNGLFRVRGLTLMAAADSTDYAELGFIINGKKTPAADVARFGARALFGRDVSRGAAVMSVRYSVSGSSGGTSVEVTPYWVTHDGTTVLGATRTLICYPYRVEG